MSQTITYQVSGHEVDLQNVLPLTLRDWDTLKKQGFQASDMQTGEQEAFKTFVFFVLNKANADITEDMIMDMSLASLTQIVKDITEYSAFAEVDRDFLKRSSTLPKSSDGQNPSS